MRSWNKDVCSDQIWSLQESEEKAIKQAKIETDAYNDLEYQFYAAKIIKSNNYYFFIEKV